MNCIARSGRTRAPPLPGQGEGAWDVAVRLEGAGGSRGGRRASPLPPGHELLRFSRPQGRPLGRTKVRPLVRTRAASLPGQGKGAWDRSWRARHDTLWGAWQGGPDHHEAEAAAHSSANLRTTSAQVPSMLREYNPPSRSMNHPISAPASPSCRAASSTDLRA